MHETDIVRCAGRMVSFVVLLTKLRRVSTAVKRLCRSYIRNPLF